MIKQNDIRDIVVFAGDGADLESAEKLAHHLGTEMARKEPGTECAAFVLCLDTEGLTLRSDGRSLRGDFTRMLPRLKTGNLQRELLVRAARIRDDSAAMTAVDATAGMGEDSLLLAAAGFDVQMFEYNRVIAALLEDTLRRAGDIPELAEIVSRMHLTECDSLAALTLLKEPPDVILLDPMFPARHKSGLVKKKPQVLQSLETPCADEAALLQAAIDAGPRKVIIKRPLKGELLAGVRPGYSIKGKTVRYDCIVPVRK